MSKSAIKLLSALAFIFSALFGQAQAPENHIHSREQLWLGYFNQKTPFAAVMNEVLLNFGDKVVYNTIDQNRFFAGFGYQFTSHLNAQLGYMNVYQQEGSGNNYSSTHAIRLFVFHSLDLRNKD